MHSICTCPACTLRFIAATTVAAAVGQWHCGGADSILHFLVDDAATVGAHLIDQAAQLAPISDCVAGVLFEVGMRQVAFDGRRRQSGEQHPSHRSAVSGKAATKVDVDREHAPGALRAGDVHHLVVVQHADGAALGRLVGELLQQRHRDFVDRRRRKVAVAELEHAR